MFARALRSTSPLCRVIWAVHGPSGRRSSRLIVTGSVASVAGVMPRFASNGRHLGLIDPEPDIDLITMATVAVIGSVNCQGLRSL
jgi:hypothetical protein